jgi:hypothetical protein
VVPPRFFVVTRRFGAPPELAPSASGDNAPLTGDGQKGAMFAAIGRCRLDTSQLESQREVLAERIVPGVTGSEGLVAASLAARTEDGHAYLWFAV